MIFLIKLFKDFTIIPKIISVDQECYLKSQLDD